ncbi:hypothetical protein [Streptomyces sp. DH12]|uniref:hypothetical protein n=1 Tax=Streptomyces sp. DH12 TaxID=2857010 RepID=UPI001E34E0E5|nr:hypothetical protein [Streptomyces sp. DH12]
MAIDLTRRLPEVSIETAQRDGHMSALAAAEHIMSTSPVVPTVLETHCKPWATTTPRVVAYFFDAPADVRQFAEHFALVLTRRSVDDEVTEVAARGVVYGVEVRAWTRVSGQAVAA